MPLHIEDPVDVPTSRNKRSISKSIGNEPKFMPEHLQIPGKNCLSLVSAPPEHLLRCRKTASHSLSHIGKKSLCKGWKNYMLQELLQSGHPPYQDTRIGSQKCVFGLSSWHGFRDFILEQSNVLVTKLSLLWLLQQKWWRVPCSAGFYLRPCGQWRWSQNGVQNRKMKTG